MYGEWALGIWTGAGIAWWLLSWWLVADAARREKRQAVPATNPLPGTLSIFKPLAPLGSRGWRGEPAGLESFLAQLDAESELLLGIHEADRAITAPFLEQMRQRYPQARLQVIYRAEPDDAANPKIAWQKRLAPRAQGELWLWSDADIIAPPGFLHGLRNEFAASGAGMLTFPYVVREIASRPALFDALYVNAEFYPGVLLLRKLGPVDFGLGAGMLFRRDDFLRRVEWAELGASLADDFVLGQRLKPVRLSATTLVTAADVPTWKEALLHHLRWSKTVWWNRPAGSAARIIVLPALGWLAAIAFHPNHATPWLGLACIMQADVLFAWILSSQAGCRWEVRDLLSTEAWSLWRVGVWLACWFPWPVTWSGRKWWGPQGK